MSNLTFSNWTSGFKAGLTAQQFQAFQALIQTSPLLVDLLNTFSKEGGSVDASGGVSTYFSPEQISASLRKDICQKSRVQSTPTTYSRSIVSAQKKCTHIRQRRSVDPDLRSARCDGLGASRSLREGLPVAPVSVTPPRHRRAST